MSKKFGLIVLVLLALTLSACQLSASTPPTATPKKNQVQASPTSNGQMPIVELAASQTAAALAGIPSDSTPLPVVIGATPTGTLQPGQELPTIDPGTGNPVVVTPQPPVQTVRPETYLLQKGEFIFCLARRFNVDPDQTLALNGLVDSETIYEGLTVRIPATGSFPGTRALRAHPATYTVQAGETIYSIACLYGDVDPMNIAAVNGLAAPYTLTAGAQIHIP